MTGLLRSLNCQPALKPLEVLKLSYCCSPPAEGINDWQPNLIVTLAVVCRHLPAISVLCWLLLHTSDTRCHYACNIRQGNIKQVRIHIYIYQIISKNWWVDNNYYNASLLLYSTLYCIKIIVYNASSCLDSINTWK